MSREDPDRAFGDAVASARGTVFLVHDRWKTVGRSRIANTHPFCRDGWAFAQAGTVEDVDFLRRSTSVRRAQQLEGGTDSESLFAYLLTCIDVAGVGPEAVAMAISCNLRELAARAPASRYGFLLSDGSTLYAYRGGEPLFLRERRSTEEGAPALAGNTVLLASAALTDEPWRLLADGDLLCVTRREGLAVRTPANTLLPPAASGPELPFTD